MHKNAHFKVRKLDGNGYTTPLPTMSHFVDIDHSMSTSASELFSKSFPGHFLYF